MLQKHRQDLRSVNILLTADGRAKIADLGSAKYQERSVLSSLSVQFNQFAAFPPESMFFARTARSYRWDIWQFGAAGAALSLPFSPTNQPQPRHHPSPLTHPAQPRAVFSGALLFELLCMELWDPAQSDTPEAYAVKLVGLVRDRLAPRGVPAALAALVVECLQWEPKARPSTAALFPRLLAEE